MYSNCLHIAILIHITTGGVAGPRQAGRHFWSCRNLLGAGRADQQAEDEQHDRHCDETELALHDDYLLVLRNVLSAAIPNNSCQLFKSWQLCVPGTVQQIIA